MEMRGGRETEGVAGVDDLDAVSWLTPAVAAGALPRP